MYYETMEGILPKLDKTIVEPRNLAPLLPLGGKKLVDPTTKAPAVGAP
jgi:membrane protease subunit HflK